MLTKPSHLPAERRRVARTLRAAGADVDARRLELAELYWVTRPMAQVALDASIDLPPWSVEPILPHPHGLLIYEPGSLPDLPTNPFVRPTPPPSVGKISPRSIAVGRAVPPAGVSWATVGGEVEIQLWGLIPEELGVDLAVGVVPVMSPSRLPREGQVDVDGLFADSTSRGLAALLGATWSMMQIPTVAETSQWTERRSKAGAKRRPPAMVTMIGLRRLTRRPVDDEPGDSSRMYAHQWVVRGHWRQQAVGVGRAERRTTWVPSYIKGPENAPLLPREHVSVWRR